jgi:hypothetical protein
MASLQALPREARELPLHGHERDSMKGTLAANMLVGHG